MGNVMVIPAKRQVGNTARQQDAKPKLRVAAYCRVSTDSDEQATSYDAQVEHYTELIQKNPEWEFAGIYADDGISGTNTKKREDFNRMIDDCEAGRIIHIDARNPLDLNWSGGLFCYYFFFKNFATSSTSSGCHASEFNTPLCHIENLAPASVVPQPLP